MPIPVSLGVTVAQGSIIEIELRDGGYLIALYLAIHVIRGITLLILWFPVRKSGGYQMSIAEGIVMVFAGLRGVIALSLALIVKLTVEDETEHLILYQDQTMFHVECRSPYTL